MTQLLVVDDNPGIRELLRIAMEDEGYTVCTAKDGWEALDILLQSKERCIVLLDYQMPGCDGGQLLEIVYGEPKLRTKHLFGVIAANPSIIRPSVATIIDVMQLRIFEKPFELATIRDFVVNAMAQ